MSESHISLAFFRHGNHFFISYLNEESFKIMGPKKLVESTG